MLRVIEANRQDVYFGIVLAGESPVTDTCVQLGSISNCDDVGRVDVRNRDDA